MRKTKNIIYKKKKEELNQIKNISIISKRKLAGEYKIQFFF